MIVISGGSDKITRTGKISLYDLADYEGSSELQDPGNYRDSCDAPTNMQTIAEAGSNE